MRTEARAITRRCSCVTVRPELALPIQARAAARLEIDRPDQLALARRLLRRDGIRLDGSACLAILWNGRPPSEQPTAIRDRRTGAADLGLVVVLPGCDDGALVRRSLKAGADGLLFERDVAASLSLTVRAVSQGFVTVPKSFRNQLLRRPLSHREKQVLRLVVRGFTNRQIADHLYLAESTVKTHLSSAFDKIDARSRAEAAALILDPDEGLGHAILGAAGLEPSSA